MQQLLQLKSMGHTIALVLVRAVLAVDLSVTAQQDVHTLLAVALKLVVWANRAVVLITFILALDIPVAAPGLWDAVHLSWGARELLWRTRGWLWNTPMWLCYRPLKQLLKLITHCDHIYKLHSILNGKCVANRRNASYLTLTAGFKAL